MLLQLRRVLPIVCLLSSLSFAQVTGRVRGSVVDASGAPVPQAKVSLQLTGSGVDAFQVVSNAQGDFSILSVRAEVYDRLNALLSDDGDWLAGAYSAAMDVFARDGWNDPRMNVYDALGLLKTT